MCTHSLICSLRVYFFKYEFHENCSVVCIFVPTTCRRGRDNGGVVLPPYVGSVRCDKGQVREADCVWRVD